MRRKFVLFLVKLSNIIRIFYGKGTLLTVLFGYVLIYFSFVSETNILRNNWIFMGMSQVQMNIILGGFLIAIFNIKSIENRVLNNILANFYTRSEVIISWITTNFLIVTLLSLFTINLDYTFLSLNKIAILEFSLLIIAILLISLFYLLCLKMIGLIVRNSIATILSAFLITQLLSILPPTWKYFSLTSISKILYDNIISLNMGTGLSDYIIMVTSYAVLNLFLIILVFYLFVYRGEYD